MLRTTVSWLKSAAPNITCLGTALLLCATYVALTLPASPSAGLIPPTSAIASTTTTTAPPPGGSPTATTGPPVSGMQNPTSTTGMGTAIAVPLLPGETVPPSSGVPGEEPPPATPGEPGETTTTTTVSEPPPGSTTTTATRPPPSSTTTTQRPNNDNSNMPDPCVILNGAGKPHKVPCHSTPAQREIIVAAGFRIAEMEGDVIIRITG